MLQCVAVCCSVLQFVAVCCRVLQCVAVCCSVLHVCGSKPTSQKYPDSPHPVRVLQCAAVAIVCCSVLQLQ